MYGLEDVGALGPDGANLDVPDSDLPNSDVAAWLVAQRAGLDRAEAAWLERLAEFDRLGLWALDGHFCCATWLVWRLNMARSTAFEKLRVAHELVRRPIIAEAFRDGRLSYSAVRAITRMDRPDEGVDQALVGLATSGGATILDLERVVRSYMLYANQDRPPSEDAEPVRDVKIKRGDDGTGQVVVTLSDLEVEEFAAALQAFIDLRYRPSSVDESSAGESGTTSEAPAEEAHRSGRKADAFMDLVNCGLSAADRGRAAGDDRYMVHVVTRNAGHSYEFLNGTPVHPTDAAAIRCDCSSIAHLIAGGGEPLNLGRKTREWSTAQRRAISVRDGGRCRFPGCNYAHYDVHHIQWWEADGRTDACNGMCLCRRHHRMLHAGYRVEGDPSGELNFYRPGGTYVGSTHAASERVLIGAA